MQSNKVVLPAPLWPISPRISPSRSVRLTCSMAAMPPKRLRTPLHSRIGRRLGRGGIRSAVVGHHQRRRRPAGAWWSTGPASGVTTVPLDRTGAGDEHGAQDVGALEQVGRAPAEADLALLHEDGALGQLSATFTDCSTTTMVVPGRGTSLTTSSSWPTMVGASPSDSSSIISTFGRHHERHGQGEHLLLAAREVSGLLMGALARMGNRSITLAWRLGHRAVVLADHPRAEPEVLVDGERREDAAPARHEGEAPAGDRLRLVAGDRPRRRAARRRADLTSPLTPFSSVDLPGPVGPEQRDDLALVDLEVDPEEDLHRPVGDLDLLARERPARARRGGRPPPFAGRRGRPARQPCRRRVFRERARTRAQPVSHPVAPSSSLSACSSSEVSSGAWSVSSTRLSATRLGTRMLRRVATTISRRSRMLCTPVGQPTGEEEQDSSSPTPVKTSWYLGNV